MGFEVDICNIALGRVTGCKPIKSLGEQSREAIQCSVFYAHLRNSTLAEYDWPFARRKDLLELTDETDVKYVYVYKRPTNCLTAWKIFNINEGSSAVISTQLQSGNIQVATNRKIDFDQGINSSGAFSTILTDEPTAYLVYTSKVFNDSIFPPKFVDALAWRLASELAVPLRGSPELGDSFAKRFTAAISSAGARAANEEYNTPTDNNDLADARL